MSVAVKTEAPALVEPQAPAKAVLPTPKSISIRFVDHAEIAQYEEAWWKLADNAVVANPFYEPSNVLPALEYLSGSNVVRFLLVFGPPARNGVEPLWGLFPLELQPKCLHLPIRTWAFWQHRYCFLATPLVDAAKVWEVLEAFWKWFEASPEACILDTNYLLADGTFRDVWSDFAIGRTSFPLLDYPRAFLNPAEAPDQYLAKSLSKKNHTALARKKRRLAELGELEYRETQTISELHAAVDDFLKLEASGWKATDGDALANSEHSTAYLKRIAAEGFERGRVSLVSLLLNGTPIAMRFNLKSGPGSFTFKIAYDESYAKYSPGMLLEVEYTKQVFSDPKMRWVDSCTTARHPLHEKVWSERRMIRRTLFSNGSRKGDFFLSALPFLRFVKTWLRPAAVPAYLQVATKRPAPQEQNHRDG